jgi:hypothetical protein
VSDRGKVALSDGHKFQPGQDKKAEKAESVRSSLSTISLATVSGAKAEAFARNVPKRPESLRGAVTQVISLRDRSAPNGADSRMNGRRH